MMLGRIELAHTPVPSRFAASESKPKGIARVILFLCSDAAKLIYGAAIPV